MSTPLDHGRPSITTAQAEKLSGLSAIHLRSLVRKGILDGYRPARDWFIYTDSLEKYVALNRKPGPKGPRKKLAQPPELPASSLSD